MPLFEFCSSVLGNTWGAVRGLYFDKPPGASWSLPWHQDKTIAVKDNKIPSKSFTRPTTKAGVGHVEAPEAIWNNMLTIRIHLDAMTDNNGPLLVHNGSHRMGKMQEAWVPDAKQFTTVRCALGSAVIMRPLLSHSSIVSRPDCTDHRRTIQIELSNQRILDEHFQWHRFVEISKNGK